MSNLYENDNEIYELSELICIRCATRGCYSYKVSTFLKDITCTGCDRKGFLIATGQRLGPDLIDVKKNFHKPTNLELSTPERCNGECKCHS